LYIWLRQHCCDVYVVVDATAVGVDEDAIRSARRVLEEFLVLSAGDF
jgi:hypothetical protein